MVNSRRYQLRFPYTHALLDITTTISSPHDNKKFFKKKKKQRVKAQRFKLSLAPDWKWANGPKKKKKKKKIVKKKNARHIDFANRVSIPDPLNPSHRPFSYWPSLYQYIFTTLSNYHTVDKTGLVFGIVSKYHSRSYNARFLWSLVDFYTSNDSLFTWFLYG